MVLTAFDQAWSLLKMPIVPGSFKQDRPLADVPIRYSAKFQDPKTTEEMDMWAEFDLDLEYDQNCEVKGGINHPNDSMYNLGDRAISHIGQEYPNKDDFFAHGTGVDEEYRRRGYATALYDMLARILHEQGEYRLTPSNGLNEMSGPLWGDKKTWPVRDDL